MGVASRDGFSDKELNGESWRHFESARLNYQISNYDELGKELFMFGAWEYDYPFVIIGQDSKITFSHLNSTGSLSEDTMRLEIRKALDGFENLHQVKKTENIFMSSSKFIIDLNENFITVNSDSITYEIVSNSDDTIVIPSLVDSQLTLTKSSNTGITNVKVIATSTTETVVDSFDVMIYPVGANIIDFESSDIYDNWLHEGDADWYLDDTTAIEGVNSARSGYIEAPNAVGEVAYTRLRTTFESVVDDTLAFAYKISSQYDSDGFEILIDSMRVDFPDSKWSGEVDWSFAEYFIEAGKHIVEWNYFKYEYGYSGRDAAWLDIIKIPGVITSIEEIIVPSKTQLIGNYPNPFNGTTFTDAGGGLYTDLVKRATYNVQLTYLNRGNIKMIS